jgi:membrane-bound lytic murein transglycosylase D
MEVRFPMTFRIRLRRLSSLLSCAAALGACATAPMPPADIAESPAAASPADPALQVARAAEAAASAASAPAPAEAASAAAAAASAAAAEEPVATVPVDPLRPDTPVDLNDTEARADLWARVRRGFAIPDLDTERVRDQERWYATRPDYVQRMTERGSRYLFHIVEEVERRGMPTELALLPFIESAFNPQAMSSAKASGMWQFMPATGRHFELKQNVFRDDRRDVLASTRAALDYLERLHSMFGDWHLALAAYNWGEGNVQRAIARNRRAGMAGDYASLRMPRETQYYVPKLQAVKNIVANPEAFALALPPVANHPHFLSVPITRDIDVDLAARLAGLEVEDFKNLNPQMNKPVILAAGTPYVLLPYDNADRFARALSEHRGALATWTAWVAPKTLRPADAARQVGMSEEQLRDVNRIPPRMLVRAGSTLLVHRHAHRTADVSERIADNAMMSLAPDAPARRRVAFKAGKKDTVASVARRYRVVPAQVAQWNGVPPGASFRPGQPVIVYLAGKLGAKASTRTASTRNTATVRAGRPVAIAKPALPKSAKLKARARTRD